MRKQMGRIVLMVAGVITLSTPAFPAGFSASSMMFPFRPVAATKDIYAVRYNPAGMAFNVPVEFAFVHQFARRGPGGDNSLMFRAKNLAASISWIKDRGFGKRREYTIGGGHALAPNLSIGTTYHYLKADDDQLDSKHTWTHSLYYRYSPMFSGGVRWENPWHTEIGGVSTDGLIVAGIAAMPAGPRVHFHADMFYPDDGSFDDSWLRGSARVQVSRDIDLAGFVDTEGRFGLEFRLLRERSAAGVESRGDDSDGYQDGTLYISVLDRKYREEPTPGVARRR